MRVFYAFALFVASCSFASAATVGFTCVPNNNYAISAGAIVNAGLTSVTCDGFDAGPGFIITNVTYDFQGSFQDSSQNGDHQLTFAGSSIYGNFGPTSTGIAPSISSAVTSGGSAVNTQSIAPWIFSVTTTNTVGTNNLPFNASYTVTGVYTYEQDFNLTNAPEPTTLALVGGVLVLVGLRKFRS